MKTGDVGHSEEQAEQGEVSLPFSGGDWNGLFEAVKRNAALASVVSDWVCSLLDHGRGIGRLPLRPCVSMCVAFIIFSFFTILFDSRALIDPQ